MQIVTFAHSSIEEGNLGKQAKKKLAVRVFAGNELESNLVRALIWFSVRWRAGFLPTAANKTIFLVILAIFFLTGHCYKQTVGKS